MRTLKMLCALLAVVAGMAAAIVPASYANPEIAKKTKKACTYCHSSKTAKEYSKNDLTAAGKYYKEHQSLEGYKAEAKPTKKP